LARIHYEQCPAWGHRLTLGLELPLDPDAELIDEVFDLRDNSADERKVIYGALRAANVTPADLDELKGLMAQPFEDEPRAIAAWFAARGLPPPEVVAVEAGAGPTARAGGCSAR
jgi:hypothetical protein